MGSLAQIVRQIAAFFGRLSPGKRATFLTLLVGTIAALALLVTWSGGVEMRLLYGNLETEDAAAIVTKLREQKVPYRIGPDGRSVLVPVESLHDIRMQLASEGLPQGGGVGFEVFDNAKLGLSEFAQNVNYQRALQGELARTIARIAEIDSCRVHLVMPERSLFVGEEQPASASVTVKLKAGRRLSSDQVNGIVHLVASSVPRLAQENVALVDSTGRLLAGTKGKNAAGGLSLDQIEYRAAVENTLESRVKSMLEQALGAGKAIVRLSCAFDFKRREKTEEQYLPENRVVRSEQSLSESSRSAEAPPQGVPGVRSNTPGPELPENRAASAAGVAFDKQDRTVNYEIGKVVSRTLEPVGEVTRVSVAVLVDGTYKAEPQKDKPAERVYVPRTAEEMQKIENLVKRAVNFDPERGDQVEVVNIAFEPSAGAPADEAQRPGGWLAAVDQAAPALKHALLAVFLVLTFLFFIKPVVRWLTEAAAGDFEIVRQLPRTVGELEHDLAGGRSLPSLDQASQLVVSDNEASLGAMRNWLKENGS
jgi:flagellar M-ring protein FliF